MKQERQFHHIVTTLSVLTLRSSVVVVVVQMNALLLVFITALNKCNMQSWVLALPVWWVEKSSPQSFNAPQTAALQSETMQVKSSVAFRSFSGTTARLRWGCRCSSGPQTRGSWNPTPSTKSTASLGRLSPHPAWRGWSMGLKCWRSPWSLRTTWGWCE